MPLLCVQKNGVHPLNLAPPRRAGGRCLADFAASPSSSDGAGVPPLNGSVVTISRGAHRHRLANHAGPQVKALEGTPQERARAASLRAAAAAKIPTSETWVNLSHAITIAAAVPSEDEEPKLTVKSFEIKPQPRPD